MIKLRRYLAYYKKECIIGPLCKLFEAILELLVPLVMAGIIDNGVRNGDTAYIWRMGGLLVILATVGLCSALVCQYLASKASQGVGTRLRRDLFLHINKLSHAELDKLGTPSLITRITYDTNQVQQSVAMAIRLLTRAPFIVIGSMVMAMTINLEMSIIFFIAAILIAVTLYLIMTKSIPIFEKMQKKLDKISLICRENLSGFTYGTGDDELEDISFKIKRGQTVGLIGGTGCGKSTLVNLIPRFYDATQGAVSVDGRNVKDYPFLQLRSQIGIVPQQSILFKGTIRDNMKWQNENATDEDIIKALKIAQAYEFVSKLNKGLDSFVEQGGKNFSGGQRQRLCIARALTGSPKLLILDDSFSALDFATDAALRKALRENTKDMTVIIVTQRCSTIKNADLILVLDDGRLVGKGQHNELFENCETYREICLSQLNEEEAKR